ncbi:MAG: hypothetical protein ABFC96_15525, partial [Thermoguttaceae bacterium]
ATMLVGADPAKPSYTLHSGRIAGQTDHVVVLLEVAGDLKERTDGKQLQRTHMSGADRLSYQELTLAADGDHLRAARRYEKAESVVKFKDDSLRSTLSPERRLVGVAVDLPTATVFALQGPLHREELEAIDVLGNSLVLDRLLPADTVAVGQTWNPAAKAMAALLGLDSTTRCDVQCTLTEVTDAVARIELAGQVEGAVNDTSTRITLKGKYRFDRRSNRIDWFALISKENREMSQVADGFELIVRLQTTVTPQEPSPELTEAKIDVKQLEPNAELMRLAYEPAGNHWRLGHDRQWFAGSDHRDMAVLKRIDGGAMLGQCNVSSLVRRDPSKLVSLEDFQADIRKALGEHFGTFIEASESGNEAKNRVLRVVVGGHVQSKSIEAKPADSKSSDAKSSDAKSSDAKATDIPVRWIYYHVADQQGRQAALTFTIEQEYVEKFADADKQLADSLRFVNPPTKKKN